MPVPPPATFPDRFFKLPRIRQKPLQRRILQYLNEGRKASVNVVSEDLGVHRFSARRCLSTMNSRGLVTDQLELFASSVVPRMVAHGFSVTDKGKRELELLRSITEPAEPYPLGYRILLCLSHGGLMTAGQIAKMVDKDSGHVRRVMKSLQNKGLVDCLVSSTRTASGYDAITHLWKTTALGVKVLNYCPSAYAQAMRTRRPGIGKSQNLRQKEPA